MSKTSFMLAAIAAIAVPSFLAGTVHAESKSFTAAKANLNDGTNIIIGVNVASITGSKLFQTMWPMMLMKAGDAKQGLELAKSACKIDVMTAVSDVVVAMDKDTKRGVVFIGVKGIDQAKLESCVAAVGKVKKKPIPTFKKDGGVIEVTPGSDEKNKDKKYYTWIGTDVIAMATEGDKDSLAKWTGGKGAFGKSALGGLVAKANTSGAMWGASTVGNTLAPGIDVKSGYGSVAFDKATLTAEVHATMSDAKAATATADKANTQIADIKKSGKLPPAISGMLTSVKIVAAGAEVVVKAAIAEKDVMSLVSLAAGM